MSRQNLEDNQTRRQRHNSPSFGTVKQRLTGTYAIPSEGPTFHFLTPNGVDRTIQLPALRANGGQFYIVSNEGTAGTGNLLVVDSLGAAVDTVPPAQTAILFSSPTGWGSIVQGQVSAPSDAQYILSVANTLLANARVVTDATAITWDTSTSGQLKAIRAALTGDVTAGANSNVTTIAAKAVVYAKIQDVAGSRLLGNPSGAPASASEISIGPTLTFSASALQTAALTGDVTTPANSFVTTITAAAVTYSKIQNVAASRILGNPTGSPTSASEISIGATLTFSGTALQTVAHTGDVTTAANSFVTTVVKVNGVAYPSAPATNTVPVVTGSNTITYEVVPVAAGGTNSSSASGTTLDNITGFASTGMMTRTGAGTYAFRTLGAGTGISISNADGVAGAPSISLTSPISAGGPAGDATHIPVIIWDVTGRLTSVTTAATNVTSVGTATVGQIPAIAANTAANAGVIGEVTSSRVAGSTVSLTSATPANATSIILGAGDWDVWGSVITQGAAGTLVFNVIASISITSATLDVTDETKYNEMPYYGLSIYNSGSYGLTSVTLPVGSTRLLINVATTVYLVVQSTFTTSTSSAGGAIYARRRR